MNLNYKLILIVVVCFIGYSASLYYAGYTKGKSNEREKIIHTVDTVKVFVKIPGETHQEVLKGRAVPIPAKHDTVFVGDTRVVKDTTAFEAYKEDSTYSLYLIAYPSTREIFYKLNIFPKTVPESIPVPVQVLVESPMIPTWLAVILGILFGWLVL